MQNYKQLRKSLFWLIALISLVLLFGTIGFHYIADLDWIDAFYSAAMFHSGLGPVFEMKTTSQKLFAAFYAILAAVIFLGAIIYFITKILIIEHL
jgi:hypothetical protein